MYNAGLPSTLRAAFLTLSIGISVLFCGCGNRTTPQADPYVQVWTQTAVDQAKKRPVKLQALDAMLHQEELCIMDTLPAALIEEMDISLERAMAERSARGTPARPRSGTAPSL